MTFYAVGVDIGTRRYHAVGMEVSDSGRIKSIEVWDHEVDKNDTERWRELQALHEHFYADLAMRAVDEEWTDTILYIEDPVVGRGGAKVQAELARAQAAMMLAAAHVDDDHVSNIYTYTIHLTSWKKSVVGKGNASKKDVAAFVEDRWPEFAKVVPGQQDYYDARCIAEYAAQVRIRAMGMVVPQEDAQVIEFPRRASQ